MNLSKRHRDVLTYITRESVNKKYHNAVDIYLYMGYIKQFGESPKGRNNNIIYDLEREGLIQWNHDGQGWEVVNK